MLKHLLHLAEPLSQWIMLWKEKNNRTGCRFFVINSSIFLNSLIRGHFGQNFGDRFKFCVNVKN